MWFNGLNIDPLAFCLRLCHSGCSSSAVCRAGEPNRNCTASFTRDKRTTNTNTYKYDALCACLIFRSHFFPCTNLYSAHLFRYAFNRTNLLFLCGNFRTIVILFCAVLIQHENFVVTTWSCIVWKMRFYNISKQCWRYRVAVTGYLMYTYIHVCVVYVYPTRSPSVRSTMYTWRLSSGPFDCVYAAIRSLNRTESDTLSLNIPAKTKKTNKQLTIQTICENQIHAK